MQAQFQSCRDGGVGPCVAGACPAATQTCITTANGAQLCCENSQIVNSSTTTAPCVDLINPSTGVSDCPRLSYLCSDPIYYNLMTQQCAKTCNRCTDVTTSPGGTTACRDLVNPSTGISDCTRMASYCTNAVYSALMRQQCPRTCGYCT
ncbi:hypothetical protein Q1695_004693 [Nippostrongylus brasiliensis]|nr:hypothetical protein Q1695_004693 [Nippostrongylus brasiliensis]